METVGPRVCVFSAQVWMEMVVDICSDCGDNSDGFDDGGNNGEI